MQIRAPDVSRAVGPQTTTVTTSILTTAQAHNRRQHGIGGVLCQGQGLGATGALQAYGHADAIVNFAQNDCAKIPNATRDLLTD